MTTRESVLAIRKKNPELSAAEIARRVGVSRERVRQILNDEGMQVARPIKYKGVPRPEYRCWWAMLDRCYNPDNKVFGHYGGRGVAVAARWRADFWAFYRDMGPKPHSRYSIDRIDNDGDYTPANCRWATKSRQQRNTRRTKLTDAHVAEIRRRSGEPQAVLAAEFGVSPSCIGSVLRGISWKER